MLPISWVIRRQRLRRHMPNDAIAASMMFAQAASNPTIYYKKMALRKTLREMQQEFSSLCRTVPLRTQTLLSQAIPGVKDGLRAASNHTNYADGQRGVPLPNSPRCLRAAPQRPQRQPSFWWQPPTPQAPPPAPLPATTVKYTQPPLRSLLHIGDTDILIGENHERFFAIYPTDEGLYRNHFEGNAPPARSSARRNPFKISA